MKTALLLSLFAGASLAGSALAGTPVYSPSPAPAPSTAGPYLTVAGGALFLQDASWGPLDVEFDTGWSVNAALGYAFGNGFAVELESGYGTADVDNIRLYGRSFGIDAEYSQVPIFANAVYMADLTDALGFYIGAGAGAVWSETEALGYSADDWNFGFQAKAGFSYRVSEAVSLNLGYRFIFVVDGVGAGNDFDGSGVTDDALSHTIEAGVTIRF